MPEFTFGYILLSMLNQDTERSAFKGRVYVGMSGGVDSSVSAALLKKAGYDVTGVFIKVWQPDWLECTWREDRHDAMRVAAHLDIPFVTLDLEKEYKEEVVDYMIREYKSGRTPNPDVMCNRHVKFGGFYDWAMKQGAQYVATGHYARTVKGDDGLYQLHISEDANKDQTYFLWTLTQKQLSTTLFPIGDFEKNEVRKKANAFGLPTADKKDSQGLCFIGKIDVKEFLSHYIPKQEGAVLDTEGRTIGTHDGAFLFTIGERHGFTVTNKTPNDSALYVISKDIVANTITVSAKSASGELPRARTEIALRDVHWNQGAAPLHAGLQARSRYREPLQDIRLVTGSTIHFSQPQSTLSSGQSVVVYAGTQCLGGGIIV